MDAYKFDFVDMDDVALFVGKNLPKIKKYGKMILFDFLNAVHDAGVDAGEVIGYRNALQENDVEDNGDLNQRAFDDGYEEGREAGYENGVEEGEEKGYDNGKNDGEQDGFDQGYDEGKEEGIVEGKEEGWDNGYASGFKDGEDSK